VLLRRRNEDDRICVSLDEEAAMLSFLEKEDGLASAPLALLPASEDREALLVVPWQSGQTLGAHYVEHPERGRALLTRTAWRLHKAGKRANAPLTGRQFDAHGLLAAMAEGEPPLELEPARWRGMLDRAQAALVGGRSTLLHGDLHLNNAFVTSAGVQLVDLELARHGPAEADFARLRLLAHSQFVPTEPSASLRQVACDLIVAYHAYLVDPSGFASAMLLRWAVQVLG